MKRFVVAYMDLFNNNLTQEIIKSNSSMGALWTKLVNQGWDMSGTRFENEEELKQFAFDCDCMVSAYEIQ